MMHRAQTQIRSVQSNVSNVCEMTYNEFQHADKTIYKSCLPLSNIVGYQGCSRGWGYALGTSAPPLKI